MPQFRPPADGDEEVSTGIVVTGPGGERIELVLPELEEREAKPVPERKLGDRVARKKRRKRT
jgi:hypothetical protein